MACDQPRFNGFFHAMLDRGVYLAPSAFEAGFVSITHSDDDIDTTIQAARDAFRFRQFGFTFSFRLRGHVLRHGRTGDRNRGYGTDSASQQINLPHPQSPKFHLLLLPGRLRLTLSSVQFFVFLNCYR